MKRDGGQGRGPDLAEKPGFLNFFGHFRPLGRPMEGHMDFYHANFSRRSHPCHPEFFPRGWMSRSLPFSLDLGPTLDFRPTLGQSKTFPWTLRP